MIPLSFEGDDTNQLPSLKLCNQFNNPNPIPGKGALGNQSRQRMFYSEGDRGRQVEILQRMLVELGYDLGTSGQGGDGVDGIFGDKTEEAVNQFQVAHLGWDGEPLRRDGLVGPSTSDALNRMMVGRWYEQYETPRELSLDLLITTIVSEALQRGLRLEVERSDAARILVVGSIMEMNVTCFVYVKLYDEGGENVLANVEYTLRGINSGAVISGSADEEGVVYKENLTDDWYELQVGGRAERLEVYYMDDKELYRDKPWFLLMINETSSGRG